MPNKVGTEGTKKKLSKEEKQAKKREAELEKAGEKNTLDTKSLDNGPVQDRNCTDILCCLIFVAFLVSVVGLSGYAIMNGDPMKLLTGFDDDARACGVNTETKAYPYLYFPAIQASELATAAQNKGSSTSPLRYPLCVSTCPKKTGPVDCAEIAVMSGNQKWQWSTKCVMKTSTYPNPEVRYDTNLAFGKFCIPDSSAGADVFAVFTMAFQGVLGSFNLQEVLGDLSACTEPLLIGLAIAFFTGFLYLIVLRVLGGPIVYISLLAMVLGTAFGGYVLFSMSIDLTNEIPLEHREYYYYGSYAVWVIAILLLLCICCNLKNIRIGVGIMKATAAFIGSNPHVFLVPPIAIVVLMCWLAFWLYAETSLASIGTLAPNDTFKFLSTVVREDKVFYAMWYNLFGYLWLNAFIIGVTQFIISASVAIWYFSSTSDAYGHGGLLKGLYWVFRYHLGSIAVGAFLIALVQLIRIIFEYYKSKIEGASKKNPVVKVLLWCTSYLLWCLENLIKFISKNAYIQIALTGKNFCMAAWNAFILILKNLARFGTANLIGMIFKYIGILFVAGVNGIAMFALTHTLYKGAAVNWITPVVIAALEGILIGTMFMNVFSFASDTIIQAFLVDTEMKRSEKNRPMCLADFVEVVDKGNESDSE